MLAYAYEDDFKDSKYPFISIQKTSMNKKDYEDEDEAK